MILPQTRNVLSSRHEMWDDGYLVFGTGVVASPANSLEAVLKFFGPRYLATSISGYSQELLVTGSALHHIDSNTAPKMLVSLLARELHMFSNHPVEVKYLEDLAAIFFLEMGECEVYTNTSMTLADDYSCRSFSWTPVTQSTCDTFICAVNAHHLGYWLYIDDE